jgi:c-di-GMP-binding flagellar brake protein YcgR
MFEDIAAVPKRRRIPRLDVSVPVEYRVVNDVSKYLTDINRWTSKSITKDISVLGMCLPTGSKIKKDTLFEFKLELEDNTVEIFASTRWSGEMEESGQCYTGFKFLAVKDNRLEFIIEYFIDNYDWKTSDGKSFLKRLFVNSFKEEIK